MTGLSEHVLGQVEVWETMEKYPLLSYMAEAVLKYQSSGLLFLLYNFCVQGGRLFGTFPWLFSLRRWSGPSCLEEKNEDLKAVQLIYCCCWCYIEL